jgi:putative DNA primase/helicase
MWLVGLIRSGKGTILRILNALIGEDNAATPTLDHLGTNFGLQPLIGKTAAIIGDARIDERTNMAAMVSRLLGISGQDKQTIDRKRMPPWVGYLSTRFTIACNVIPEFKDSSDALMKRIILLSFRQSFCGREDIDLEKRLLGELPGILRWAIDGWHRLQQRGHFV